MRTMVVHTRQLQDVRDLVSELGAEVNILPYKESERSPKAEDLGSLVGAEVVLVGVRKRFRRVVEQLDCERVTSIETVRGGRQHLVDWLRPYAPSLSVILSPRESFTAMANEEQRLVIAEGALDNANRIVTELHPWSNRAAEALRDLASSEGRTGQELTSFFRERHVTYATSGGCAFRYRVVDRNGSEFSPLTPKLHRHLKQGDGKNTPEEWARVYFDVFQGTVIVARVGPHPSGDFDVIVRAPSVVGEL